MSEQPIVSVQPQVNEVVVTPQQNIVAVTSPGPPGPAGLQGVPGGPEVRYRLVQSSPAGTWQVHHNLGYKPPFIGVIIDGDYVTDSVDISHTDENNLVITLSANKTGEVTVS